LAYLKDVKARRELEVKLSFEGRLAKAVISLVLEQGLNPVPFDKIRQELARELGGEVDKGRIILPDGSAISPQKIGKRISEVLKGERKVVWAEGRPVRVWKFDEAVLWRLAKKYLTTEELSTLSLVLQAFGKVSKSGKLLSFSESGQERTQSVRHQEGKSETPSTKETHLLLLPALPKPSDAGKKAGLSPQGKLCENTLPFGFWSEFERRLRLKGVFSLEWAIKTAMDLRASKEEARKAFERLRELGRIAKTPEGDWAWVG